MALPAVEALEDRSLPSATMVTHFAPGALTNYGAGVVFQNELYFTATISQTTGLYKSDGTAAGTVLVKTLVGGPNPFDDQFTVANNTLFFDWDNQLWKSDGTSAGTSLLKDFNVSKSPELLSFTSLNGTLYFIAPAGQPGTAPVGLWKSDGTAAGTVEVNLPAAAGASESNLTAANGKLYFTAGAVGNVAVWESDGTAAGTTPVVSLGNARDFLAAGNGEVYFAREVSSIQGPPSQTVFALEATDGSHTQQLGSDITAANLDFPTLLNGKLYFFVPVSGATSSTQLWEADGSTGSTLLAGLAPGAGSIWSMEDLTAYNGKVYFAGWDANHGIELWKTDGTAAGTGLVDDINPGAANSEPPQDDMNGAWSYQMTVSGGKLYFTADDGTHGDELWQTDGTASGTVMTADLDPGSQGSNPQNLINVNGTLFFTANDGTHGEQLWTVLPAAPAASTLSATGQPITAVETQTFSGKVATFTDSSPLAPASYTATITWGNGKTSAGTIAALGNGQFSVSGSTVYPESGDYPVSVQINRAGGGTATATTTAAVSLIVSSQPIKAVQGQPWTGAVASFIDNDPLAQANDRATISWGDGQATPSAGVLQGQGNGRFVISGSHTYAQAGTYTVTVQLSLANGGRETIVTTAVVAPLASGQAFATTEGQPFSGEVATFYNFGPVTPANFTAPIAWGDGQTSAGTVTALGNGLFAVSGSHTYARAGTFTVKVQINQAGGTSRSVTTSATVADEPIWATRTFQRVGQGQLVTGALGTLTDLNPLAAPGDFAVTINWGDGSQNAGTLHPTGQGTFTITGTHAYDAAGAETLTVTVTDEGGRTATTNPLITVDPAPATVLSATGRPITTQEGQTFSGVVATFTDSRPQAAGAYAAAITWGNGQVSAGTVAALGNGQFSVSGSNVYAHAGTYAVSTRVTRPGGISAVAATTASVADEPFWATRTFQHVAVGQPVTGALGTLTDLNLSAVPGDFTVVIDWSDGTKSPGLLLPKGKGAFDIVGTHSYASAGARTLTVTLTDEDGRAVTTDPLVTVDP